MERFVSTVLYRLLPGAHVRHKAGLWEFSLRSECTWTRVGRCGRQRASSYFTSSKMSWETDSTFWDQTDVD